MPTYNVKARKSNKYSKVPSRATSQSIQRNRLSLNRMSVRRGMISSNNLVHTIGVSAVVVATYNPTGGLVIGGQTGFNPVFAVNPAGFNISLSNAGWDTQPWSNGQSLAQIFQEIRIKSWSVEMHYSSNSQESGQNKSNPIVYTVIDREDALGLVGVDATVQYAGFRIYDALRDRGHTIEDKSPTASTDALTTSTFIGTTASALRRVSPWIALGSNSSSEGIPNIPHGNIKAYIAPGLNIVNAVQGQFTIIVRAIMEYRGID